MAVEVSAKITSTHVRNALRLRYPPGEHALLWEVANGTGAGGRRFADAVAYGLWPSHGCKLEGIEIKVTRADFLNEMKQAAKSQPIYQHCHHWWLACPKDMVKPEELPQTWGLLELQADGTLRAKKKAPLLEPLDMPREFIAALLRRHAGLDEEMTTVEVQRQVQAVERYTRDQLQREFDAMRSTRLKAVDEGFARLTAIKEETGIDFTSYSVRDDDGLLQAIKIVHALRGSGRWASALGDLRRSAERVLSVLEEHGLKRSEP